MSRNLIVSTKIHRLRRTWYRLSRNYMSIVGIAIVFSIVFIAIFASLLAPYPEDAANALDLSERNKPPSLNHFFGTDFVGRDILSRIMFGFRFSLMLGIVTLSLAAPPGILIGLLAGYFKGTWIETVCMRLTDVFLGVPPLILAMAITATLKPNLFNAMIAVSLCWWPWYCRLTYGLASSLRNENFIQAAKVMGARRLHILIREILPNCIAPILTKLTLDMGFVIVVGAALSFVGLGVQPPEPGLGTMISQGTQYFPEHWWMAIFPAFAIILVVLGFNLLGDGVRDVLDIGEI